MNEQNDILVSIVIPMYNAAHHLRVTLDSIINQVYRKLEIIIVDDGSTDDSVAIAEEYAEKDERICIYTQKNQGAAAARNRGISLISGEYVMFLDADDIFEPDMVSRMSERAVQTNADVVICNFSVVSGITGEVELSRALNMDEYKQHINLLRCSPRVDAPHVAFELMGGTVPWNKLFRKELIVKHNIRYENLSSANDLTFVLSACTMADSISYIDNVLVKYLIWPHSISHTRKRNIDNIPTAILALFDFLKAKQLWPQLRRTYSLLVSNHLWHNLNASYASADEVLVHVDKWRNKFDVDLHYLASSMNPLAAQFLSVFAPSITLILPQIEERHLKALQIIHSPAHLSHVPVQILYVSASGEKLFPEFLSFPAAMPIPIPNPSESGIDFGACKPYVQAPITVYPGCDTKQLKHMCRKYRLAYCLYKMLSFFLLFSPNAKKKNKALRRKMRYSCKTLKCILNICKSH